jgi:hypothetical protein
MNERECNEICLCPRTGTLFAEVSMFRIYNTHPKKNMSSPSKEENKKNSMEDVFHNSSPLEDEEHDAPKKRRKTGWDKDNKGSIMPPVPPMPMPPSFTMPSPFTTAVSSLPNPTSQAQATAAEIAAKLALQQQLLSRTNLANLAPASKPGCRLYVG